MRRPASVTASAIIVMLGSALALAFAALMFFLPETDAAELPNQRGMVIWMVLIYAVAAATGFATGTGIFRLQRWSRIVLLIFAGALALFGVLAAVISSVVPFPELAGAAPLPEGFRTIMIVVFAIPTALGIWWLILFTRPRVIEAFGTPSESDPAAPPTSIIVIAWLTLFGGVSSLGFLFVDLPWYFLGVFLDGWMGKACYLAFALFQLYVGRGLLRLEERSRVMAIWFYLVSTLNAMLLLLLPNVRARMVEISTAFDPAAGEAFPFDPDTMFWWIMATVLVVVAVQTWLLIKWKPAFHRDLRPVAQTGG